MLMWKGHMGIYLEGITWAWLIIKWLILTSFVIWAPVLLYEPQCLLWLEWGLIQQCQAGSQCCWYPCGWASSLSCCREKWIAASLRAAGKGEKTVHEDFSTQRHAVWPPGHCGSLVCQNGSLQRNQESLQNKNQKADKKNLLHLPQGSRN